MLRANQVTVPELVADGSASPAWFHNAADTLVKVLPHASHLTLAGQTTRSTRRFWF